MFSSNTFDINAYLLNLRENTTSIDISRKNLDCLPDLSRFTQLKRLICSHNNISYLPELPVGLLYLDCSHNNIKCIPKLNESLEYLNCSFNIELSKMPLLNDKLMLLKCSDNDIGCLPPLKNIEMLCCPRNRLVSLPELPPTLTYLDCTNNGMRDFPCHRFHKGLKTVYCSFNQLTRLPEFNEELETMICSNNQLERLPILNDKLEILECENNKLICLPYFNNSLRWIDCSHNKLEKLPSFNDNLLRITCGHNKLKEIPTLPHLLDFINCESNRIEKLPALNRNLKTLICSYNRLTVIPHLNNALTRLDCTHNKLMHLPVLNENMLQLNCVYNNITALPVFNDSLESIIFSNNPIYTTLYGGNITLHHHRHSYMQDVMDMYEYQEVMADNITSIRDLSQKVKTLHDFRFLFYSLKYKSCLRNFLWEKIRRPKIEAKYHPDNLQKLLKNITEDNDVSEIWTAADN